MQITVNDEMPELNARLTSIYQTLNGDLTELMASIGNSLTGSTHQRFADKKSPEGDPWAELLPSTVKAKGNDNILVKSGLLVNIVSQASSASVAIGTDRPYGKYHQVGTKHMAARPFLGISDSDKSAINEILDHFMERAVNGH